MPTTSKSSIITKSKRPRIPPLHPGEMLREEFMAPMELSANALAIAIGVPATRITEIVNERRGITADTALRLGQYFRVSAEFRMNVQQKFDLDRARDASMEAVLRDVRPANFKDHPPIARGARRSMQQTHA